MFMYTSFCLFVYFLVVVPISISIIKEKSCQLFTSFKSVRLWLKDPNPSVKSSSSFSYSLQKEHSSGKTLIFSPVRLILDFWPPEL